MFRYLILLSIFSLFLFGDRLSENIEKAQKIVFISFGDIGTEKSYIEVPFMDCSKECDEVDRVKIPLESSYLSKIATDIEKEVLAGKFDFIYTKGDKLIFQNIEERFFSPPFVGDGLDFYNYNELVNNYINSSDYQSAIRNILLKSLPMRLTIKSNRPLSKSLQERLLAKSYLIYLYIDTLDGEVRAIQSRKDGGFSLKIDIDLILKMAIFKYIPEKGILAPYGIFDGASLNIETTENLKALYALNYFDSQYQEIPKNSEIRRAFFTKLRENFKEALSEIVDKIVDIDDFKIHSPVLRFIGRNRILYQQIGDDEFLRVNAPVYFQYLDQSGELVDFGWGRVEEPKMKFDKNSSITYTKVKLIGGKYPYRKVVYTSLSDWSGYLFGITGGVGSYGITHNGKKVASISSYPISLNLALDLGYLTNWTPLTNLLVNLSLFTESNSISLVGSNHIAQLGLNSLYGFDADIEYRYYLRGSLYVSGIGGIVGRYGEYDIVYFNQVEDNPPVFGDGTLYITSYQLKAGGKLGWALSPNLELFGEFGYSLPIYEDSSIKKGSVKVDTSYFQEDKFGYEGIMELKMGLLLHYDLFQEDIYQILDQARDIL